MFQGGMEMACLAEAKQSKLKIDDLGWFPQISFNIPGLSKQTDFALNHGSSVNQLCYPGHKWFPSQKGEDKVASLDFEVK